MQECARVEQAPAGQAASKTLIGLYVGQQLTFSEPPTQSCCCVHLLVHGLLKPSFWDHHHNNERCCSCWMRREISYDCKRKLSADSSSQGLYMPSPKRSLPLSALRQVHHHGSYGIPGYCVTGACCSEHKHDVRLQLNIPYA